MSEVKVNKISPRSGTEVTLGDSGDTFTIPSGATINNQGTATNFGATGSASWTTTVKTATFTAVAGEGYFCNTSAIGAFTVNLPAGTAGAVVAVKDYLNTFDTANLTLSANGSDKIGGSTDDVILTEEGLAVTLIFIDSTRGWLVTDSGLQSEAEVPQFVAATGGTVTTSGNFKIHTFTGPGTFCVSNGGNPGGSSTVSYMVVAGGGAGGKMRGGAGGAGGFREGKSPVDSYSSSPQVACGGLPVSAQAYPIQVGGGATAATGSNSNPDVGAPLGTPSIFSTITSTGGGKGAGSAGEGSAVAGGSGGGSMDGASGGSGNTPTVTPPQGNDGGVGAGAPNYGSGGGGGAGGIGSNGSTSTGGVGGAGITTEINASAVVRAGGGGGSTYNGGSPGPAHPGGGGGGAGGAPGGSGGANGTDNTGGGGGGGYEPGPNTQQKGGNGGSGIVIIRYKYQ
jgi:hypothetical protein